MLRKKTIAVLLNYLWILLLGIFLGVGGILIHQRDIVKRVLTINESSYWKFELVNTLLETEYLEPEQLIENHTKMMEKALKAYVEGIGDPHTTYLSKEENIELQQSLHEESGIEGIGAVIEKKDGYIQIEEIVKNWPAYKAGLQPLDRIFFIETGSVKDLTTSQAVQLIRGPEGSEIKLYIQRISKNDGKEEEFRISITREKINLPSVIITTTTREGKNIVIVEISSISEYTTKLFMEEITPLISQGVGGIILDLRGNSWGYLEEAAKFLGHFIPKGELLVKSEYQHFQPTEFISKGFGELSHIPMVILVDQLTASAGEIIALTLQEKGILVLGTQSFGKGTIQTVEELTDGSSIKYTIGKRYSPQGNNVNITGITPDIEIERDAESYKEKRLDNQLEEAKKELIKLIL